MILAALASDVRNSRASPGISTVRSPAEYHANSSATLPALSSMYPSSDIDMFATTLPIAIASRGGVLFPDMTTPAGKVIGAEAE
ncbi:hypothetical protein Nm8I071_23730 [Nonomuraea sp. TT08I-71]|nr:hypothetical protein Nm8I071_23730 [Nonomuraea sp. TT08I-71]